MTDKIQLNPDGGLTVQISETPSVIPVNTGGTLPAGYPPTAAALRKLMLQTVYYPHLLVVQPMRFAWSYELYANKTWTEADFLGTVLNGGALAGMTNGIEWQHTDLNASDYVFAIWVSGPLDVFVMTEDITALGWQDLIPLSDFWDGPTDLTVNGVDGKYYAINTDYVVYEDPNPKTARVLLDPGTAGLPP